MMFEIFIQFVVELIRALIVDELSGRLRRQLARRLGSREAKDIRRAVFTVHRRNRERLFNRLLTGQDEDS
jgi:hypothetical protein